jgi:CheY-like chemotaxis protein/HPt (histidine-containing phosphotransfer) domain-containing protein
MNNDTPTQIATAAIVTSTRMSPRGGSNALEEQLQALRTAYAARLPEKVARLEELCKAIEPHEIGTERLPEVNPSRDAHSGGATPDDVLSQEPAQHEPHGSVPQPDAGNNLATAHRLAHNLAGSGATYGLPHLSRAARALEQHLKTLLQGHSELDEQLNHLCSTMKQTAAAAMENIPMARVEGSEPSTGVPPQETLQEHLTETSSSWQDEVKRPLFLLTNDLQLVVDIEQQIGYFGYAVRIFSEQPSITALANALPLDELDSAVIRMTPAVLIVDAALDDSGIERVAQGQKAEVLPTGVQPTFVSRAQTVRHELGAEPLPVIYVAEQGDMLTRLQAVRSGGAAYFTKPLDIAEVIDSLDALTTQETQEPYRILIVDDDPQLLEFYAWALQSAGMQTQHVSDPLQILEPLTDFRPDLI